jgi:hypothetical protein
MRRILWCFVTYSQRISVEAERQRLSAIDSNDHLQNMLQSERAEEAERISNADTYNLQYLIISIRYNTDTYLII